jgi:hypothetical protein
MALVITNPINSHRHYEVADGYIREKTEKLPLCTQIRLFAPVELGIGRIEEITRYAAGYIYRRGAS